MRSFYINIIFFILVYAVLIFWDYYNYNTFNWIENGIQSLAFVVLVSFFSWLWGGKNKSSTKKDL